jgi:hypothetical protein
MNHRECRRCSKELPPDAFYKRSGGGLRAVCITCYREEAKARETLSRREHPERHRVRWLNLARKRRAEKCPRERARAMVRDAIRRGRIGKPKECEGCKRERPLHGHHHDYAQPLAVTFLCVDCHAEAHRKLGWR